MTGRLRTAALVCALACLPWLAGCQGDEAPAPAAAPSTSETPTEPPLPEGTDLLGDDVPEPAVELCGAYAAAHAAFDAAGETLPPDPAAAVPPGLLAAFRQLGTDLDGVPLPGDITSDQAAGVALQSEAFTALPDDATVADLTGLDNALGNTEERQVGEARAYVGDVCGLAGATAPTG